MILPVIDPVLPARLSSFSRVSQFRRLTMQISHDINVPSRLPCSPSRIFVVEEPTFAERRGIDGWIMREKKKERDPNNKSRFVERILILQQNNLVYTIIECLELLSIKI